jgi:hypothetical protein
MKREGKESRRKKKFKIERRNEIRRKLEKRRLNEEENKENTFNLHNKLTNCHLIYFCLPIFRYLYMFAVAFDVVDSGEAQRSIYWPSAQHDSKHSYDYTGKIVNFIWK